MAVIIRAGSPAWGEVEDLAADTVFTATDAQVADGVWVLVREGLNGELQVGLDEIVGSAVISAGYGAP